MKKTPLAAKATTPWVAMTIAELLVAVAHAALAWVLGCLAMVLGGATSDAAGGVAGMTSVSGLSRGRALVGILTPTELAALGVLLIAARAFGQGILTREETRAAEAVSSATRLHLLAHALRAPKSGGLRLLGHTVEWPAALAEGVRGRREQQRAALQLVGLALLVGWLDGTLGVLLLLVVVPFAVALGPIRRRLRARSVAASERASAIVEAERDVVEHAAVWATCGGDEVALTRVAALSRQGASEAIAAASTRAVSSAANELTAGLAITALVAVFAPVAAHARPTLVPVILAVASAYRPLRDWTEAAAGRARARAAEQSLAHLDAAAAPRAGVVSAVARSGALELKGVALDVGSERCRRGVSFVVAPGEIMAIVGAPGCGKSALLEAIVGVRAVVQGRVLIGKVAIEDAGVGPRARSLAWTPAAAPILPGTLGENLAPDAPNDEVRRARARAVLSALGDRALTALDDDALLGPGGRAVSSGEAQRITLARAIASDAHVLLFDEPTASLDAEGEARAIEVIEAAAKAGRVVVLVTHRPAPLRIAHATLSLEDAAEIADDQRAGSSVAS